MSGAIRTTGPLHFEDLEPRRFEDLARQLIYDFRPWRSLEATGRAGSDEGFDARGMEIGNADAERAPTSAPALPWKRDKLSCPGEAPKAGRQL